MQTNDVLQPKICIHFRQVLFNPNCQVSPNSKCKNFSILFNGEIKQLCVSYYKSLVGTIQFLICFLVFTPFTIITQDAKATSLQ